jgi:thymidylate kinase
MKHPGKTAAGEKLKGSVIALALTWDGARWPARTLPPKARAFLTGPSRVVPSARKMAELFADDRVREIRVCWVPRLKGGSAVLSESFQTPAATRIGFQSVKTVRFGDILGVIYRRTYIKK